MLKLACFLLASAAAKLHGPAYDYVFYEQFNRVQDPRLPDSKDLGESAWALSLDEGVESLKLRLVGEGEVREVFGSEGKSGSSPRRGRRVKKDDPAKKASFPERKQTGDEKAIISEIMRVINKFALTTNTEPEAYISQDTVEESPSLKLYFQGDRTSLVLRAGARRWHYVIGPPALFPEWFREQHPSARDSRGAFVAVPNAVKREFLEALYHILTMLLSFPL